MKVLLVNGSPHKKGCTWTALSEVAKTLKKEGIGTEIFWIGIKPLAGLHSLQDVCQKRGAACLMTVSTISWILRKTRTGFIFGSPCTLAAASGAMTSFMDRVFFTDLQSGGQSFYLKPAAAVVSARRAGTTVYLRPANKVLHHHGDAGHFCPVTGIWFTGHSRGCGK